jgi:putative phosphoribosyl transferase
MAPRFQDRADAGRQLARRLLHIKGEDPVVLALPRGGVHVGHEVATALDAPLDLVLVRKIGAPDQPELALGAVVDGDRPETVLNQDLVDALGVTDDDIRAIERRELAEIGRRRREYLGHRAPVPVAGRTAVVVDDGIATGATMRAALRAIRRQKPKRLVLAVPVAPAEVVARIKAEVDDFVCLMTPEPFYAIGIYYADFAQLADADVTAILGRHPSPQHGGA